MSSMTIGEVARRAGIGIETVRYYQRRGLIVEPPRPARGFRRYGPETLATLQFIRRVQGLGFSLKEIEALLAMRRGRGASPNELVLMLAKKEQEIARKIRELEVRKRALQRLARACESSSAAERWSVFDASNEPGGD